MTFRSSLIGLAAAIGMVVVFDGVAIYSEATAASFDCAKAQTPIEQMICGTPELSQMDEHLAELFAQVRADSRLSVDARENILADQRAWLGRTYACADANCLQALYVTRIDQLQEQQQAIGTGVADGEVDTSATAPDPADDSQQQVSAEPEQREAPPTTPVKQPAKPLTPAQERNATLVVVGLVGGGVLIFLSLALVVVVYHKSKREFDYDMLWNRTSLLWIVYFAMLGLSFVGGGAGLLLCGPIAICCWLVVAYVNVRKTNLPLGLMGTFFAPVSLLLSAFGLMWIYNFTRRLNQGTQR